MSITNILYISANPDDTGNIRTEKEYMQIQEAKNLGKNRDAFHLVDPVFATHPKAMALAFSQLPENSILHISGHGNTQGQFLLEDEQGNTIPVEAKKFVNYLKTYRQKLIGIIYSTCYSDDLWRYTSKELDVFCVGFSTSVDKAAAALFAYQFYLELLNNETPKIAYERAFEFSVLEKKSHETIYYAGNNENKIMNNSDIKYNLRKIRLMLDKAFITDTDLREFCLSYFTDVHDNFGDGQDKSQHIMKLINHCRKFLEINDLLNYVKDENPKVFDLYQPYY